MTTLDQSFVFEAMALSWVVTTSIVWLASRCWMGVRRYGFVAVGGKLLTSRVSPQHRITPRPPSSAAFVLLAMNYTQPSRSASVPNFLTSIELSQSSPMLHHHLQTLFFPPISVKEPLTVSSSFRITLLSLCPHSAHVILLSLNCSALISPVKAPLGLSNTFCEQTSISGFRCSRTRRRKRAGGERTTSAHTHD